MTSTTSGPRIEVLPRPVRSAEVGPSELAKVRNGIGDIYDDALDAIVVRGALPTEALSRAAGLLQGELRSEWESPNKVLPGENIELVGLPATPTARMPRGPSMDTYLQEAAKQTELLDRLFTVEFDVVGRVERLFAGISGGLPVELLTATGGRKFAPLNIRSLGSGQGLTTHMDDHYLLDLYRELGQELHTAFTVSFYTPLQCPESGGELHVYGVTRAADALRLPTGRYDAARVEGEFARVRIDLAVGDLVIFCGFHQVVPSVGTQPRITMGGFISLGRERDRVIYWS